MAALNIANLVLVQILRISQTTISQHPGVQNQLLYLILIPHVIILLFLYGFSTVVSMTHKGFRNLFAIVGYIFLVVSGWYGGLVPILILWWQALIGIYLFVFILTRLGFHPGRAKEYIGMAKSAVSKLTEGGKKGEALEKQIEKLNRQIKVLEKAMRQAAGPDEQKAYSYQIGQLKMAKADLEHELEELD